MNGEESIPLAIIVLLLLFPVLIIDRVNNQPIRSWNARITKWLMFGVIASNALFQISVLTELFLCAQCEIIYSSWGVTKSILKFFNGMFWIHRAKLVQGITPVLSKKWFEKIFPAFLAVIISGFIFASIDSGLEGPYDCVQPYDNWSQLSQCEKVKKTDAEANAEDNSFTILIAGAIGLDCAITVFFMALFIIPLYRVYKVDLGVMICHQLSQRKKLKHLLIWCVVLTFINQVTSILVMAEMLDRENFPYFLKMVGESDPTINVWTAWLMITRNREYLKRLCCRHRTSRSISALRRSSTQSAWTNQLSRTSNIKSIPSSIQMISVELEEPVTHLSHQTPEMRSKS